VKEQSHKDEMRAALLGDFTRLRARQQPAAASAGTASRPDDPPNPSVAAGPDGRRSSWLDRLRHRL